jgi:hypothetical protein
MKPLFLVPLLVTLAVACLLMGRADAASVPKPMPRYCWSSIWQEPDGTTHQDGPHCLYQQAVAPEVGSAG